MRRLLSFLLVLAAGCGVTGPGRDIVTLEVAPNRVPCTGEGIMECFLVREPPSDEWTYFYAPIEGFTFEPGYRYVLRVARFDVPNPPVDGSSIAYVLVRVVSRDEAPRVIS